MLASVLDPFHGLVERHRGPGDEHLLGVEEERLDSESTTDVGCHDTYVLLRKPERLHKTCPDRNRGLRGIPHNQLIGSTVVVCDDTARLHWHGGSPIENVPLAKHHVGLAERAFDIADGLCHDGSDVRVPVRVDWSSALPRLDRIDYRRERLDLVLDQLECVLGDVSTLGDDHRERLTLIDDLLARQGALRPGIDDGRMRKQQRKRPIEITQVGGRVHGHHSG